MPFRTLAALLLAFAAGQAAAEPTVPAHKAITCINPFSGTTWRIAVDLAHATVDTYRARITDETITWHDPRDGGRYRLDRVTGALTVAVPSSTGGYFLHDRCRPGV